MQLDRYSDHDIYHSRLHLEASLPLGHAATAVGMASYYSCAAVSS